MILVEIGSHFGSDATGVTTGLTDLAEADEFAFHWY